VVNHSSLTCVVNLLVVLIVVLITVELHLVVFQVYRVVTENWSNSFASSPRRTHMSAAILSRQDRVSIFIFEGKLRHFLVLDVNR
jgi:hypothetical protein